MTIRAVSQCLATLVLATAAWGQGSPVPQKASAAHYGNWGFDPSGEDESVKPGDNFFQYANGTYVRNIVIPPDRTSYGVTSEMSALVDYRIHQLIENRAAERAETSSDAKVVALYQAFMNEALIERLGTSPLQTDLTRIRDLKSKRELARYMGESFGSFGGSIFELHIEPDLKQPPSARGGPGKRRSAQ